MTVPERFDAAYYARFYAAPDTRVASPADFARQADLIYGMLRYYRIAVRRIADIGCGTGALLRALGRRFPAARLVGVEASAHAAHRYGWVAGDVRTFRDKHGFDLLVCNDVLQYLGDRDAKAAIANLAKLCRGALYFGVMTRTDFAVLADRKLSDPEGYFRAGRWYRRQLDPHFEAVGSGVFLKRELMRPVWELEGTS